MKFLSENNRLTVFLEGRIDTNNAAQVEKELIEENGKSAGAEIVIDADKLEYISSAGLRVLMKLRKQQKAPFTVVNVSRDIFDIFETTGFTELMDVRKKLREISVEGCELVGEGGNGRVYRLDNDKIVKLYSAAGMDSVKREQEYARTALVNGIPTVIPYDVVKCGDNFGVVFELVRSDTLGHAISAHPEMMDELTGKYAELAKKLHSTHIPKGKITDVRDLLRSRIEGLAEWTTAEERKVLSDIVDNMPESDTILHNDLHPGNIMIQDGEFVLIDLAEVTVGPKAFDLAAIYRDMIAGARTQPDVTEKSIGMSVDMVEQVGQLFFVKYTGITDPDALKEYFGKIGLLFAFNTVLIAGAGITSAKAFAPQIMDNLLRPVVIPNKDAIPYLLSVL